MVDRPRLSLELAAPCLAPLAPRRPVPASSPPAIPSTHRAVVPAGASLQGRLCAEAIDVRGRFAGEAECGWGPLVIHSTGRLEGRATAQGDVVVAGTVAATCAGDLISTPGRLVLLGSANVEGDVRCGALEIYPGARLAGVARGHPGAPPR
jgi:cytoskeletal protein CcmA (bactofilin family)